MKKRIAVVCNDKYLRQKLHLLLPSFDIVIASHTRLPALSPTDTLLWNTDEHPLPAALPCRVITMGKEGRINIPFVNEELFTLLFDGEEKNESALLVLGEKCVFLRGELLRLTEMEFSLLRVLCEAGGSFVSREELLKEVWGEGVDGGILNVYVHYLREKLEYKGEKIIISSRKQGYKIDEKYLNEGGN